MHLAFFSCRCRAAHFPTCTLQQTTFLGTKVPFSTDSQELQGISSNSRMKAGIPRTSFSTRDGRSVGSMTSFLEIRVNLVSSSPPPPLLLIIILSEISFELQQRSRQRLFVCMCAGREKPNPDRMYVPKDISLLYFKGNLDAASNDI